MTATENTSTAPFVGQAATIHLFTDSIAAVVTKINKKSIVVARVATTEAVQDKSRDGADYLPVMIAEGILDEVVGSPERYSIIETEDGPRYRNGSIGVTLGRSIALTDYRY